MKRLLLFLALTLAVAHCRADQITFVYTNSGNNRVDLVAANSGLNAGPAINILVTDTTKNEHFDLPGIFTANTGPATAFVITPTLVVGTYNGSGANSVLITDPMGNALVSGMMEDQGALLAHLNGGSGAFLGTFDVTFIDPAVLALFGLTTFHPSGSISMTFAQNGVSGGTKLNSVIGGGTVTVVAGTPTIETSTFILLSTGIVLCGGGFKLRQLLR